MFRVEEDMAQDGDLHSRSAVILYGSETGNAFDFAQELGRMTERIHFSTDVTSLDSIELVCRSLWSRNHRIDHEQSRLSQYSIVLAITSTTGQGDVPANARQFWKSILRRKLPPTYLSNVRFTTFGLGDSSYPKYVTEPTTRIMRLIEGVGSIGLHANCTRGFPN